MIKLKTFIIGLFALTALVAFKHEYHMSLTRMDYNQESNSLEVTIKMFTEDFEKALAKKTGKTYEIDPEKNQPKIDSLIQLYINEKLTISNQNQIPYSLEYVGKEPDANALLCYFEITLKTKPSELNVYNDIFNEIFSNQQNHVVLKKGKEKKAVNLNRKKTKGTILFN